MIPVWLTETWWINATFSASLRNEAVMGESGSFQKESTPTIQLRRPRTRYMIPGRSLLAMNFSFQGPGGTLTP